MNNKNNTNLRITELDALRGVAALIVLVSHYTWVYDFHFGTLAEHSFSFSNGDFGVQLFFMISGFMIFMSLENSKTIKKFIIARFARLFPTYWLCILITLCCLSIFPVPTLGNYSLTTVLLNFSMIHGFFNINHID